MDAIRPVAELNNEGTVVSAFVYGSKPHVPDYMVSRKEGDWKLYRIVSDSLGSVRLMVRVADGLVVQRSDWSAYGIEIARDEETGFETDPDTGVAFQPFGFAGGLEDRATGLVKFGMRDYDPEVGRFITPDPVGFAGHGCLSAGRFARCRR